MTVVASRARPSPRAQGSGAGSWLARIRSRAMMQPPAAATPVSTHQGSTHTPGRRRRRPRCRRPARLAALWSARPAAFHQGQAAVAAQRAAGVPRRSASLRRLVGQQRVRLPIRGGTCTHRQVQRCHLLVLRASLQTMPHDSHPPARDHVRPHLDRATPANRGQRAKTDRSVLPTRRSARRSERGPWLPPPHGSWEAPWS